MIDIHTHLLPQVDDGSEDWTETLAMIRQGIKDGITGAVCTPHVLNILDEAFEGKVLFKFQQLEEMIRKQGFNFAVWPGSEIHSQAIVQKTFQIATLNRNKKYMLIELPLVEFPMDSSDKLFKLHLDGITPILAHPERNSAIMMKREIAYQLVQQGTLVQINAGSLLGDFGGTVRKTAFELMNRRMVHFVASDCHSAATRPMLLGKAFRLTAERWGKETADRLFRSNPRAAVAGEAIDAGEPLPPPVKKTIIQKIFGK
jgi:protein-tyrosine phosphatase